jgi:hypothetical protein
MRLNKKQKDVIDKLTLLIKLFTSKNIRKCGFISDSMVIIRGATHSYITLELTSFNHYGSNPFYDMVLLDGETKPRFHYRLHPFEGSHKYKIKIIAASEFLRQFMYLTDTWDEDQLNLKLDQYIVASV